MSVLRELVARLGFQVDGEGFKKAETAVDKVKGSLEKLGQVAALAGLGAGLQKIVKLASDANETSNVLEQVFGVGGAQQVKDWAAAVGTEVGRSQFQLREFAGTLGAMLDPMVGNQAAAKEMSTTLAQLAVDLGSFFNATDEEALTALRAGITGESEPLRRFGVVLLDATLQEYARAKGIQKSVAAMNVAEKTQLRYQFILDHTQKAQGDAARTSTGYANGVKALRAALRDIGTEMGQSVLPKIERVVGFVTRALRAFKEWTRGTHLLEAAMIVLGTAAAGIAATMLAPFVMPALAIAGLILLLDDLQTMFAGGTSVIGHYIDAIFGIGTTDEFVRNHAAGIALLSESWSQLWSDAGSANERLAESVSWLEMIETAGVNARDALSRLGDEILDLVQKVPLIGDLIGPRELSSSDRTAGRGVNAPLMSAKESARQNLRDRNAAALAAIKSRKLEFGDIGRATGQGGSADAERIAFGRAAPSAVATPPTVTAPVSPVPASDAVARAQQVAVNAGDTNVVMNINGGNIAEVRRAVTEVLAAERRRNAAAVARAGGS